MSTNFPTSLDTTTQLENDKNDASLRTGNLADFQNNAADAILALEAKVGITASAVTTSLDYLLKAIPYSTVQPLKDTDGTATGAALLTTVGMVGTFRLPQKLVLTGVTYESLGGGSANAIARVALYRIDSATVATKVDEGTDAVGAATGIRTVALTATLTPGLYLIFICMDSGTTGPTVSVWSTLAMVALDSAPFLEGTIVVTAGAAPATINPSTAITPLVSKTLISKLK